ncbi:hypothetical protein SDJN02_07829 [Cucurbita argyrosperma subsp. argyrosperma]|nr:hypothetical protein SDJN02_07829 [Cucurbita argyrosperma subsp. argyrosperma]
MYCNLTYHLKDTLEQHNPSSQKALCRSCFVLQQLQTGQNPKAEPTTQKEKNFRLSISIGIPGNTKQRKFENQSNGEEEICEVPTWRGSSHGIEEWRNGRRKRRGSAHKI